MLRPSIVVRFRRTNPTVLPSLLFAMASLGCAVDAGELSPDAPVLRAEAALGKGGHDEDRLRTPAYPWDDDDCDDVYELRAGSGAELKKPYLVQPEVAVHPQFLFDAPWGDRRVRAVAFHPLIDNEEALNRWYLYDDETQLSGWVRGRDFSPEPPEDCDELPRGEGALRLDLHYHNRGSKPVPDRSGVALCVKRVERGHHGK